MEQIAGRSNVRYSPDVTVLKRYGNNCPVEFFLRQQNLIKKQGKPIHPFPHPEKLHVHASHMFCILMT